MIDFKDIQLKELLTVKYHQYNQACFIDSDPIQIPHRYQTPEDREISGFLTTTIAWGKRTSIIHNASRLMQMMGNAPYDFVMNANDHQIGKILAFTHRTFQGEDCFYFIHSLRNIYQ